MKRFNLTEGNADNVIPAIGHYLRAVNLDKPLLVTVSELKETRRSQANRLYWKWVSAIGNELGYEGPEMHDVLVLELLGMVYKQIGNKTIQTLASTRDMKVGDFSDYMESVSRFAAKQNIRLPAEI